jgi:hypothetical protein
MFRTVTNRAPDNLPALSRPRLLVALVGLALVYAKASTSRAATATCANEQLRQESDINPVTGKPFSTELPGCRAYELMTPETNDSDAVGHQGVNTLALISGDGDSLLWQDVDTASYAHATNGVSDVFSTERGAGGWSPPLTLAPENNDGREDFNLRAASGDLSTVLLEGARPSETTEINGIAFGGSPTSLLESGAGGCCTTIASDISGATNGIEQPSVSTDGSHAYFQTLARLLPEDEHGPIDPFSEQPVTRQVYEWTRAGGLRLAGVDSKGAATSACGAALAATGDTLSNHDVSADGSRVYFESPDPALQSELAPEECRVGPVVGGRTSYVSDLYVREDGSKTMDISRPPAGVPDYGASFVGASEDGAKVFFVSESQLTPDQTTFGPGHANLFEYDVVTGVLTRLSVGPSGYDDADLYAFSGEPDKYMSLGQSAISSADGSHVYFTALGQLVPGAGKTEQENMKGCPGVPGPSCTANLYVSTRGRVSFIATVGPTIEPNFENEYTTEVRPSLGTFSAALASNGSDLAFESTRSLTGYNSEGHGELYRYDAVSSTISCMSCSPTGVREGGGKLGVVRFRDSDQFHLGAEADGTPVEQVGGLSSDGSTVFFAATGPRLPAATNSTEASASVLNVYEWHDGVLSLLSTGTSTGSDELIGASPNGSNVFFATRSQLVVQDGDHAVDIYDARVEGGLPAPATPAPCVSLATCRSMTATPPVTVTPASVNVSGPGNVTTVTGSESPPPPAKPKVESRSEKLAKALKVCAKDKSRKKRLTCEKLAKKKYGSVAKKKSKNT